MYENQFSFHIKVQKLNLLIIFARWPPHFGSHTFTFDRIYLHFRSRDHFYARNCDILTLNGIILHSNYSNETNIRITMIGRQSGP